jgi:hypothetical protein
LSDSSQLRDAERNGPDSVWRSFVFHFLLAVTVTLCGIGTLNYLVNPEGLYDTHLVPQILWGSRPQKAALLKAAQPPPQALIMGSSRVMNLAPAEVQRLTGLRTLNAGVDAAKAEDFYILLRYAVEVAHVTPKLLVLGYDIEAFHNHQPPHYYLQQPSLLASFLWQGDTRYWRWHSFTSLLTHAQTSLSAVALYKSVRHETEPFGWVDADGKTYYAQWERERAAGRLDLQREIRATVDRIGPRFDDYTGLSSERLEYFDSTLQYAQDHGMEIVVFLTPTHPAVEEGLSAHGYLARKAEVAAAIQHICAGRNVPFYDFSSPASFEGTLDHFYDGVHYDETLAPLIFPRMLPVRSHAVQ